MRAALLFLLGLVLGACCQPPSPSFTRTELAADLAAKTVALIQYDNEGDPHAYCSGVWVRDQAFLTASHCAQGSQVGEAILYSARVGDSGHAAILIADAPQWDLALFRPLMAPAPHPVAKVAPEGPWRGQWAQTMGHPRGLWWSYSSGEVSGVRKMEINDLDLWWVQATAPVSGGNSGGGLFGARNELIGVCHAFNPRGQNLNFFVHPMYVRQFLEANP